MVDTRLERLLARAASHPWYRRGAGGGRLADWPVLTKEDLYGRLADFPVEGGLYFSRSGGTTSGRPLYFPTDVRENHAQRRLLARRLRADGVLTPETVALNICPIIRMYRAMEIFTELGERCGATMLPFAALAEDDELYEAAVQFGANTLVGMPSRLIAFARYLKEKGLRWKASRVVFGGEFLQPAKRRLLEETLQVERFGALYGSAELGIVAWQPESGDRPVYRFPRDLVRLEVLDPDAEGFGRLVATNLCRVRFPLIRYDTGDRGRLLGESDGYVVAELGGRHSDSFLIGDNYHCISDFTFLAAELLEFQIQIRFDEGLRKDVIRFCLVPAESPVPEARRRGWETRIRETLQGHEKMYRIEVDVVTAGSLVRGGAALKTPAIVDSRGR